MGSYTQNSIVHFSISSKVWMYHWIQLAFILHFIHSHLTFQHAQNCKLILISLALRSDCQGFTLTPLLTSTVDTMYCDVVVIACHETSQFMLCNTGSGDVQKFPIWDLGSVGGNVDEVGISTVSTTQSPAHSDSHSSTDISRDVNTGEGGDRGRSWRNKQFNWTLLEQPSYCQKSPYCHFHISYMNYCSCTLHIHINHLIIILV